MCFYFVSILQFANFLIRIFIRCLFHNEITDLDFPTVIPPKSPNNHLVTEIKALLINQKVLIFNSRNHIPGAGQQISSSQSRQTEMIKIVCGTGWNMRRRCDERELKRLHQEQNRIERLYVEEQLEIKLAGRLLQAPYATTRHRDVLIRLPICIYYCNLYNNFQRQSNGKDKNFHLPGSLRRLCECSGGNFITACIVFARLNVFNRL